jgi:hypothetical protein
VLRAISGWVSVCETDQPLPGLTIVAVGLGQVGRLRVLGMAESGPEGRFRMEWPRLREPVDIAFLVASPSGRFLLRSTYHRQVAGVELHVHLQIATANL